MTTFKTFSSQLKKNIHAKITELVGAGTVGMSMENLRQLTPAPKVRLSNDEELVLASRYDIVFDRSAREVCNKDFPSFLITE